MRSISFFWAFLGVFLGPFVLSGQSFTITISNPDKLLVCKTDTLQISIRNNTGVPLSATRLTLNLPTGVIYEVSSVINADEADIADLQNPLFGLEGILAPDGSLVVTVVLRASCDAISPINSGQLFFVNAKVQNGAFSTSVTGQAFLVEMPLVVITQVQNDSVGAMYGQMIMRTIVIRNTRLGPLSHLYLTDKHEGKISIEVLNASSQNNTPLMFDAYFGGDFFTAFGDGDTLFEFNETIEIKEKITVTDCGYPNRMLTNSLITAGWNCEIGQALCQSDSARAEVMVETMDSLPALEFFPEYAFPWDQCGKTPHGFRVKIVNKGKAPAQNVIVAVRSSNAAILAFKSTSVRLDKNGAVTPVVTSIATPAPDFKCNPGVSESLNFTLPFIDAQDSLYLIFDGYYCIEECRQALPAVLCDAFYKKDCPPPPNNFSSSSFSFTATVNDELDARLMYSIGTVVHGGDIYPFQINLKSTRLLQDTGYVRFALDLPWGVFWDTSCQNDIAKFGTPEFFSIDTLLAPGKFTRVETAYKLPVIDSILNFCLRFECRDDGNYTELDPGVTINQNDIIIPSEFCYNCGFEIKSKTALVNSLDDAAFICAPMECDTGSIYTDCEQCPFDAPEECIPNFDVLPTPSGCLSVKNTYSGARLNYDFRDDNNDRIADDLSKPDLAKVRQDRFLPGDTLELVVNSKVLCADDESDFMFYEFYVETIRSDFPYGGANDPFAIGPSYQDAARGWMANDTLFKMLEPKVTIWKSNGQSKYTFNPDVLLLGTRIYMRINRINTLPNEILDEAAIMHHAVLFNFENLKNAGLLPPDFKLEAGDSIELKVDYKLDFNFKPYSPNHRPPLINFEATITGHQKPWGPFNYRRSLDTMMFQYSGFIDSMTSHIFGILPCENSIEVQPYYFETRIARPNMFPYEVRPLAKIADYTITPPLPGISPVSANINQVRLQPSALLYSNIPLPFAVNDTTIGFDFSNIYSPPIDEGYNLRANIVWPPLCDYKSPRSSYRNVILDYPNCMSQKDPMYFSIYNKLGYYSNRPLDTMTTDEPIIEFPTSEVNIEAVIKNFAPITASNYFVFLESLDGGLSNLSVNRIPQNTPYPDLNGIFQLGNMSGGVQNNRLVSLKAINNTCLPQRLRVIYGWSCSPIGQLASSLCEMDTFEILVVSMQPELELDIAEQPTVIPLCDTSAYFVIDVFNADLGFAFDPFLSVQLPQGITIVPGTSQVSYPSGSPFSDIPDPKPSSSYQYLWHLDSIIPYIYENGLPGVNTQPQNTVKIRFKVQTVCGAISAEQMVVGTGGLKSCGEPTNLLNKASAPLLVEGFTPSYGVNINIQTNGQGPIACNQEVELLITTQVSGVTSPGDSIYVQLPPGLSYVQGSYVPVNNAPVGPPQVESQVIRLPFPTGNPPNAVVVFRLRVTTGQLPVCGNAFIKVQARQRTGAFCPTLGTDCAIYISTGQDQFLLESQPNPIVFSSFGATFNSDATINYSGSFSVNGTSPYWFNHVDIYKDGDQNGIFSPGDSLVATLNLDSIYTPGAHLFQIINQPYLGSWCHLIAVIPAEENCICGPISQPIKGGDWPIQLRDLCVGDTIAIGFPDLQGVNYSWSPATGNLSCNGCAQPDFSSLSTGIYNFIMESTLEPGCVRDAEWTITVDAIPELLEKQFEICRGGSVTLSTSQANSWQWSGPGIVNPNASIQVISPTATATYQVTITKDSGCSAAETATVKVKDTVYVDLGLVRTCKGTPVNIGGIFTDVPGEYCNQYIGLNGCDSTVCGTLELIPETASSVSRCENQTLTLYGQTITKAGVYCFEFPSSTAGCDSVHCISVTDIPSLTPFSTDTIAVLQGDSVQLLAPPGFAQWSWSPDIGLSCTDCPNPIATPIDTIEYTVVLTNAAGCSTIAVYRMVFAPPCDPVNIQMPDAFSPNGDNINEVFEPVPSEGFEVVSRMRIYSRWGEKIFEKTGFEAGWDGKVNGSPSPSDVYIWLIEIDCSGQRYTKRGEVTLFR